MPETKTEHFVVYALCQCYVWPIVPGLGRCGRCRTKPEGWYRTKDEGVAEYVRLHGREPRRMGT